MNCVDPLAFAQSLCYKFIRTGMFISKFWHMLYFNINMLWTGCLYSHAPCFCHFLAIFFVYINIHWKRRIECCFIVYLQNNFKVFKRAQPGESIWCPETSDIVSFLDENQVFENIYHCFYFEINLRKLPCSSILTKDGRSSTEKQW